MIRTREDAEAAERESLAPYAQRAAGSAGRAFSEPAHEWRTCYERDRARIIHSRGFRRLEYKTQVFLSGTGDHLRTRLTHTMEVASITRAAATALRLNADLAETIALAHDLGHAPVGHAGEETLNALMQGHGGFEHNLQSLRIVEIIESKYPHFPGLNLSWEVLEGLRKHERSVTRPSTPDRSEETFRQPSLEAQIANLADEIAYYSHDIEDGLDHELITLEQLASLEIWRLAADKVHGQFPGLTGDLFARYAVRTLIDHEVEQLVRHTAERVAASSASHADDVRRAPQRLAAWPDSLRGQNAELRRFLYTNLYHHPVVAGSNARGCERLAAVFHHYLSRSEHLGDSAAARVETWGLHRTVCDYVAGFTDRYLIEEAGRLEGSTADSCDTGIPPGIC